MYKTNLKLDTFKIEDLFFLRVSNIFFCVLFDIQEHSDRS